MTLIGFQITNLNGQSAAAIAFIQQVCMLADPSIAANLVAQVPKVKVYPNDPSLISEEILAAQPFTALPVYTTVNITAISIVDFPLELPYIDDVTQQQSTLKLAPTDLADIDYAMYQQFRWFITNSYIRTIPAYPPGLVADYTAEDFSTADFYAE